MEENGEPIGAEEFQIFCVDTLSSGVENASPCLSWRCIQWLPLKERSMKSEERGQICSEEAWWPWAQSGDQGAKSCSQHISLVWCYGHSTHLSGHSYEEYWVDILQDTWPVLFKLQRSSARTKPDKWSQPSDAKETSLIQVSWMGSWDRKETLCRNQENLNIVWTLVSSSVSIPVN